MELIRVQVQLKDFIDCLVPDCRATITSVPSGPNPVFRKWFVRCLGAGIILTFLSPSKTCTVLDSRMTQHFEEGSAATPQDRPKVRSGLPRFAALRSPNRYTSLVRPRCPLWRLDVAKSRVPPPSNATDMDGMLPYPRKVMPRARALGLAAREQNQVRQEVVGDDQVARLRVTSNGERVPAEVEVGEERQRFALCIDLVNPSDFGSAELQAGQAGDQPAIADGKAAGRVG